METGLEDMEETREIVARYKGSVVIARVHNGGLMVCPVCGRYYFTSEKDLILHIVSHAKQELYKYSNNSGDNNKG